MKSRDHCLVDHILRCPFLSGVKFFIADHTISNNIFHRYIMRPIIDVIAYYLSGANAIGRYMQIISMCVCVAVCINYTQLAF